MCPAMLERVVGLRRGNPVALSVTPCGNRKTWDARVRVTGGHPELLWGIGDAEALTAQDARVERVAVDRG